MADKVCHFQTGQFQRKQTHLKLHNDYNITIILFKTDAFISNKQLSFLSDVLQDTGAQESGPSMRVMGVSVQTLNNCSCEISSIQHVNVYLLYL